LARPAAPPPRAIPVALPVRLQPRKRSCDRRDSGVPMRAVLDVILLALDLYIYVVIAAVILSWLIAFNVVNTYNGVVRAIVTAVNAMTEPVLRPIRQALPNFGGLDLSPIVLFLGIYLIQRIIIQYLYPNVF
jgi:YggT family protein